MFAFVAPLAGAWIEITGVADERAATPSLPSRERGLKFPDKVTSLYEKCRSPRGSVD